MNDEKIGAFMDREGDDQARSQTGKSLEENAGGAMRLRIFKKADDLLRRAMPLQPAVSDHVLSQRILNAKPIRRAEPLRFVRILTPLAAACLLGILIGNMNSDTSEGLSLRYLDGGLRTALETAPSGATLATTEGDVTVTMTLRTPSGDFCRQFRLSDAREATDAIACRHAARWRVIVATAVPHISDDGYHLAAGGQATLDAALNAMGTATVLDETEEQAVLRDRWDAQ